MEASMDQSSGKGWRLRRVLPFALGGVGLYAAIAYGSAVLDGPTHLVAQRVVPADQVVSPADPLPAGAPVQVPGQPPVSGAIGQVPAAVHDVLPADAGSVAGSLNNGTSTMPAPAGNVPFSSGGTALMGTPQQSSPIGNLAGSVPVVNALNLPVAGSAGGSSAGTSLPVSTKNIAGLGGATLPSVNGTPLGGLLP
jgi:hypothetical protein